MLSFSVDSCHHDKTAVLKQGWISSPRSCHHLTTGEITEFCFSEVDKLVSSHIYVNRSQS